MSDQPEWTTRLDRFCDRISNRRLLVYTATLYAIVIAMSYIIEGVVL